MFRYEKETATTQLTSLNEKVLDKHSCLLLQLQNKHLILLLSQHRGVQAACCRPACAFAAISYAGIMLQECLIKLHGGYFLSAAQVLLKIIFLIAFKCSTSAL